jgi:spore germination protein
LADLLVHHPFTENKKRGCKMKRYIFFTFLLCLLCTVGCTQKEHSNSVEDLAMVSSIAFDYINEDEVRMTVSIPKSTGDSEEITQNFSVNTSLIQEGFTEVSSQAGKMITLNQLRTMLFSEEYARNGDVEGIAKHFYRDPTVGNNIRLAIVKDSAEDILKGSFPNIPSINTYLYDLLQPKMHTSFSPFTTLHDYINSETDTVSHSSMPYLEKKEDSIKIESVALFDGGKMLETISRKQSSFIQALKGLDKLAPLDIRLDKGADKEELHIELIENKVKIKSNRSLDSPQVSIRIKLQGSLIEYKGDKDLSKNREFEKLQKDISKHVEKEVVDLLEKLRKLEVDPVGFSEYFRMYHKGKWNEELTKKIIASAEYKVSVNFDLLNTGILK